MIKILHTADWHANYNYDKFYKSYLEIRKYIKENNINLLIIAGDIFDSRMFAGKQYITILNLVAELSEYCPILIIYGTPSHDYKGSLDPLPQLSRKYQITLVENVENAFYIYERTTETVKKYPRKIEYEDFKDAVIISCLPWPMKYRLLTDEEMKLVPKEQDAIYTKKLATWLNQTKKLKKYGIPTFLVSHLQLNGSIVLGDQDISSDNHDPKMYYDVADYSLLGHIHKHQNIKNLYYSGSIYNKTWNELEDKYFNVWTIDKDITVERVKIDTPKKIKVECTLEEYNQFKGLKVDTVSSLLEPGGCYELWFVISLSKKEQLNVEEEVKWWNWYEDGIEIDCRIDLNTLKIELSDRAKSFDIKTSLIDKFINWCKFKELKSTEFQINKIKELEDNVSGS